MELKDAIEMARTAMRSGSRGDIELALDTLTQTVSFLEKCTKNGYDPHWIVAINGVLEDRETELAIEDITDEVWERFIGPMVDAIERGEVEVVK